MTSVLLATPCKSGYVTVNYMMSLFGTLRNLQESGIKSQTFLDVGKAGIDLPRSMAASYLLNSEHTHLMFLDDDMAWQPELVTRLLSLDLDIVGVPYRQKSPEIMYNMRVADKLVKAEGHPSLLEFEDIATGLLLIKKSVFEAMRDKVEWVVDHSTQLKVGMYFRHQVVDDPLANAGGKSYMSEDLYFCRLARESGFKIIAYVDAETAHTGTLTYKGNYKNIAGALMETNLDDPLPKSPIRLMGAYTE